MTLQKEELTTDISELLTLGSGSSARRKLLVSVGLTPAQIVVPEIDERCRKMELPLDYVKRIALEKCNSIKIDPNKLLITADTIVTIGRKILHKTTSKSVAKANLLLLTGRRHSVYTAYCVKKGSLLKKNVVKTTLKMKRLDEKLIDDYLLTDQWINRAGSYGIQGRAISFFPFISGCFSNIIGLPLPMLVNTLDSMDLSIKKNVL